MSPEDLTDQLEFENRIKDMTPLECSMYVARQTYRLSNQVDEINKKIDDYMKPADKRIGAISGGISGGIIAASIAVIEYIRRM